MELSKIKFFYAACNFNKFQRSEYVQSVRLIITYEGRINIETGLYLKFGNSR